MKEDLKEKIENSDVLDSMKSREIVQKIMDFGVNDFQIRKIIKFLALELENRETMVSICKALDEENPGASKIEI